jgi:hypothetical protein
MKSVLKDDFYKIAKKRQCSQRFLDFITDDCKGVISSEFGDEMRSYGITVGYDLSE